MAGATCGAATVVATGRSSRAGLLLARTPGALVVELTDAPSEHDRAYRSPVDLCSDLTEAAAERLLLGLAHDLAPTGTAVGVTEATWRDALTAEPHFADVTGDR